MQTLALANQKGGCGKTTVAVNLAASLAAQGQRVLLVDLDPQAHATLGLGVHVEIGSPTIASALLDRLPAAAAVRSAAGGVDLIPASLELSAFEAGAERRLAPEGELARALAPLAPDYDYCLIDCPPRADGVLTMSALRACDRVLLVVETGAFALQGALRARELFAAALREQARRDGPEIWVVATLFDRRTRFAREVLVAMQARFGSDLFDTAVRHHVRLREAAGFGLPVRELDPKSLAAADFDALARELLARVADRALDDARRSAARAPRAAGRSPAPAELARRAPRPS